MTDPHPSPGWRLPTLVALAVLVGGLGYAASGLFVSPTCHVDPPPGVTPPAGEPTVGGRPLFADWPTGQAPAAVIVLSGETFGFLQPCGCTSPQTGGLERRANFIASLKARNWPVAAADLGDLYPDKAAVKEQGALRYATALGAMRDMGYVAVGVGPTEFKAGLTNVLAGYALQKEQRPFALAGNLAGKIDGKPVYRDQLFPPPPGATRPLVGQAEVADVVGVAVGFVGLVGPSVAAQAEQLDKQLGFESNEVGLPRALAALDAHPKRPALRVLLFQGSRAEAETLAGKWPQFQVILCRSSDSEPPPLATSLNGGKTVLVQVGHKGRYVAAVGAFGPPGGPFQVKAQLVPMTEYYLTANTPEAEKANAALPHLDQYSALVKGRNLLARVPKTPHASQVIAAGRNLSFVGSAKCAGCHAAEFAKWGDTPHSHALETLEKKAKKPAGRDHDGECVVCHVVGLEYDTGFVSADKTPLLKHVGCESCHGPGSGHSAEPKDEALLKLMSPWKLAKDDRLPDKEAMARVAAMNPVERNAVALPGNQQVVFNRVSAMCQKCHDGENDPNFDLYKYWPKVNHTYPK